MADESLRILLRRLRRVTDPAAGAALSDAQLLERFLARRDQAAFELLVWRHGAMVLNLCRRVLRHEQDAEDAFQATFLVLARKAAAIGRRQACGSWLYKVAYRVALAARSGTAARAARERSCLDDVPAAEAPDEIAWRDLRPVLDEEVGRLPEKYRAAFVLCCLEGRTNAEAAEQLGCPEGTVQSRLSRARERLRRRLLRRGVGLSAGLLAAVAAAKGQAAELTAGLVTTTAKAALGVAAGKAAAAVVSARAAALTEGAIRAMFMTKLKAVLGVVLTVGAVTLGATLIHDQMILARAAPPGSPQTGGAPPPATAEDTKPPAEKKADPDDPTEAALRRLRSRNNLKQIGLALNAYSDMHGHFPAPAIYSKDGKPLLSWRVAILPFIEQDNLYKQFKLDEPWDGPTNKPLAEMVLKVYTPELPADKGPAKTYYQAIVGQGAGWEPRQELKPVAFLDGTSNTILVVEAATPVPWTKPEDLPFVPDQALPKFGGPFGGNFHALMADGSVQFLSRKADEEQLRYAIIRDDGNVVDFTKLRAAAGEGLFGKPDLDDLPRQNARIKEVIKSAAAAVKKEQNENDLLLWKVAAGNSRIDEKTASLLKENAELRKELERVLESLENVRASRKHLEQELQRKVKP